MNDGLAVTREPTRMVLTWKRVVAARKRDLDLESLGHTPPEQGNQHHM
jgi:hypothetical protein